MFNQHKKPSRLATQLEREIVTFIIGQGHGLYDAYANDVPKSIKETCDYLIKTQGAVRVAYSKESIMNEGLNGQDIARSLNGILHYHESAYNGVTHWTPNTYYKAVKASDIADSNLRRVRTFGFDIDQKTSVQQVLYAFEMAGIPCKPSVILETPKGVQFFVVFKEDEAWYGSMKAIEYAKAIGEAIRYSLAEQGLQIDMNNSLFGWSRFPREESIMFFDKENAWTKEEAVEWFKELDLKRGKSFMNGKWLNSEAGRALWNTNEKGSRNEVIFQLSVMAKHDGFDVEDALEMLLKRNGESEQAIGVRRLEKTVRSAFKRDYYVSADKVEMLCGVRPKLRGFYKHKKSKEERTYEKTEELVDRTIQHLEKRLPVGEGESLSISASQLANEMNQEKTQVKSLTRAFKQVPKSKFIIQKKRDAQGNVLKGRTAGFIIFRTQDYIQMIADAKKSLLCAPASIVYRVAASNISKNLRSDLMCQLPIHLGTVPRRLSSWYTQYIALVSMNRRDE